VSLLELRDVHVTYASARGPVPAVRGVDLTVDAGESVGVAGESGCGKSTLAMSVLRLLPEGANVTGSILLNGEDVLDMRWGRLRAVRWSEAALVLQGAQHSLNPVQRVGTQIAEPIRLHDRATAKQASTRVGELLEMVGLPASRAAAFPHQLSGGQRQRVMIAMALACRPELIIADEPTTALDVMVQAQVLALVTQLVRDLGMGLLLISHDLGVLSTVCDRVDVMYAGRIVEDAAADSVFTRARHPYTHALSSAFPHIGDASGRYSPSGLPGDPPLPGMLPSGCPFHPRCDRALPECSADEPRVQRVEGGHVACRHPREVSG
jgi:peptide/nickel transport system ATP-binding protein